MMTDQIIKNSMVDWQFQVYWNLKYPIILNRSKRKLSNILYVKNNISQITHIMKKWNRSIKRFKKLSYQATAATQKLACQRWRETGVTCQKYCWIPLFLRHGLLGSRCWMIARRRWSLACLLGSRCYVRIHWTPSSTWEKLHGLAIEAASLNFMWGYWVDIASKFILPLPPSDSARSSIKAPVYLSFFFFLFSFLFLVFLAGEASFTIEARS